MKTNLGDRHVLISPSRTYILFVADKLNSDNKDHVYKVTVPDSYENTEIGASSYFFEEIDKDAEIASCLTYEMYAEQILEKHFEDPFKNLGRDRVVGSSSKNKKGSNDIPAVSFSRTYLVAVYDGDAQKGCRLEKFELPEGYKNNSDEALVYYGTTVEPDSHILECSSYELFAMAMIDMFDTEFGILGRKTKHQLYRSFSRSR